MPEALRVLCGRPFVDLAFQGPARTVTACTWVDTGGGALILSEELARGLGVSWEPGPEAEGVKFSSTATQVTVARLPIEPVPARTLVQPGRLHQPGYPATAFLPAHLLAVRDVLFDYPGGQFDVAPLR